MTLDTNKRDSQGARHDLRNAIRILENLGIIDFNGHLSARLPDGSILINSGSSVRSAISIDDFVIVDLNGDFDDKMPAPPKELPLHLAIYKSRPDVGAVVHGHPKWSTLLSSAGIPYQVTMAQGALLGDIPTYESPKSASDPAVAKKIAELLGTGQAVLLRAHGSVIAAGDILQATVLAIYLELNAERYVSASALGSPYVFSAEEIDGCRKGLLNRQLFEKCWNYYLSALEPTTLN